MKPTEEQIKKFWERCGFIFEKTGQRHIPELFEVYQWRYPDGEHYDKLPPIDLNNLFEYAVPKTKTYDYLIDWAIQTAHAYVDNRSGYDPALALFWAIWKVIND